jgi:hypothetical protein
MEKTGRGRGRMLFDDLWSFLRKILFWLRRPKCKCNSALSHTKNDGNTLNYVSHLKHFVHKSFNNYNHLRLGVSTLYLDLNQESLDTNWECLNINQESLDTNWECLNINQESLNMSQDVWDFRNQKSLKNYCQ